MKIIKFLILSISLNLILSCTGENGNFNNIEDYLIDGTWKLESTERFYYYDDEFDRSEVFRDTTDSNKLTFNKDHIVIYDPSFMTIKLNGNWELNEDETYLFTDLSYTPPASSGYGTIYHFPQNKIIEINRSMMILETMDNIYYLSSQGTKLKVRSYERMTFIKE